MLWGLDGRPAGFAPAEFEPIERGASQQFPLNTHRSAAIRQRAIFDRIGAEFVQRHRQQQRFACIEPDIARTADHKTLPIVFLERRERAGHDIVNRCPIPAFQRDKIVGTCERTQRPDEGLAFLSRGAALRLQGDGLHRRQRILERCLISAMRSCCCFLRTSAFGNVSSNLRGAHDPAIGILDRRDGQRDLDQAPILAPSEGFVTVDTLAVTDALENFRFLLEAIQWNQNRDRFANDLIGL